MAIDFPSAPVTNDEFTAGDRIWVYDGTVWNAKGVSTLPLDNLSDVVIDTPVTGQALTYDGTEWGNSTVEALPSQTGNAGELLVTDGSAASWSNTITANSASSKALIVKGTSSQSANIQEWQSNGGTVLASISSAGQLKATPIAGVASTSASAVGYIGMPQNPEDTIGVTLNYTLTASDAGKHVYLYGTPGGAPTITIPANGTTAFEIGTTIVIINDMDSATNASIAITTDTLVLAGAGTTGTRTLARYGMATLVKVTATRWIISGNGLS